MPSAERTELLMGAYSSFVGCEVGPRITLPRSSGSYPQTEGNPLCRRPQLESSSSVPLIFPGERTLQWFNVMFFFRLSDKRILRSASSPGGSANVWRFAVIFSLFSLLDSNMNQMIWLYWQRHGNIRTSRRHHGKQSRLSMLFDDAVGASSTLSSQSTTEPSRESLPEAARPDPSD